MVALVVTVNNSMHKVNYDPPHYEVIKKAVGGWYEHVRPVGLESPYCMMVNEEGLRLNLPPNRIGSELYGTPRHGQPIVGDIIFLKYGYYCGERDVVGMTEEEAQALGDKFINMTNGAVRWRKTERSK